MRKQEGETLQKKEEDMRLDLVRFGPSVRAAANAEELIPLGNSLGRAIEIDMVELISEARAIVLPPNAGGRNIQIMQSTDALDVLVRLGIKLTSEEKEITPKKTIFLRCDHIVMTSTVAQELVDFISVPDFTSLIKIYGCSLVFTNCSDDLKLALHNSFNAVRRTGMVYNQNPLEGGNFIYVGNLPKMLSLVLDRVAKYDSVTPSQIADDTSLSESDVKNRLKSLYDLGLLKRSAVSTQPTGRDSYVYNFFDPAKEFNPTLPARLSRYTHFAWLPKTDYADIFGEGGPLRGKK